MHHANLTQLDQHLQELPPTDLQALNQYDQLRQYQQRTRTRQRAVIVLGGLLTIGASMWAVQGMFDGYVVLALVPPTLLIMIGALSGNRAGLLGLALVTILHSVLNLLFVSSLAEVVLVTRLLIGSVQLLLALYYIREANQPSSAQMHAQQTLYQTLYSALYYAQPNKSNQLIALHDGAQTIIVWLRLHGAVILLKGAHRLIIDIGQGFNMTLQDKDTGGTQVLVKVYLDGETYLCTISRHDWLRYTLFAR
ncbi:MAG: hypothetical protein ACFE0Q_06395 [Anaerolineae bacterium]